MSTTEHQRAIFRVWEAVDEERRAGVPYLRERDMALVSLVEGPPSRFHCTPTAEMIDAIRAALTRYEALRPEGGFPEGAAAQPRAHVAARANVSQEGDYVNRAITVYERARRGEKQT
jgi:hypothetical protein